MFIIAMKFWRPKTFIKKFNKKYFNNLGIYIYVYYF